MDTDDYGFFHSLLALEILVIPQYNTETTTIPTQNIKLPNFTMSGKRKRKRNTKHNKQIKNPNPKEIRNNCAPACHFV